VVEIHVKTLERAVVERGSVLGSAPHGMNVRLVGGGTQLCDVPAGDWRVLRVTDEGFTITPHKPRHLGNFRGWAGPREPTDVRRNP